MTLLIKPKTDKPQPKQESLQEKVGGFKFNTPKVANNGTASSTATSEKPKSGIKPGAAADKPNGNGVLQTEVAEESKPVATQFKKPADPIPEMSDDKYEVVAGSAPEFSEEAGNAFQEQLEMLQQAIDGTGDLKDQMQNILTFLDDNPQYKENVSPPDIAVFVAACRKVAGITVTEKKTRQTKKTKSTAQVEDVLADLADLSFEL